MIARLQASGIRIPNELQVELKSASRNQLDAAVSKAIQLLQPTGPSQGVTDRQRELRAVGIGNPAEARDPLRDRDMETIWCGEFERLQALVAKRGGNLSIETTRPVGQYPLKIISGPSRGAEADTERQLRSLPR